MKEYNSFWKSIDFYNLNNEINRVGMYAIYYVETYNKCWFFKGEPHRVNGVIAEISGRNYLYGKSTQINIGKLVL